MATKIVNFIREAKVELSKVNWLTKKQVMNYTLLVVGASLAVAIFLGGLDYVLSGAVKKLIIK